MLPDLGAGERWEVEIDTAAPLLDDVEPRSASRPARRLQVEARSVRSCGRSSEVHLPAPGRPCRSRPTGSSSPAGGRPPGFGFDDAAAVVPYLAELGVTHLYCSPWLQAAPGSAHGYDVVDHSRVNDELGGSRRSTAWSPPAARRASASCSTSSPTTWRSASPSRRTPPGGRCCARAATSPYADWFDVDWEARQPARCSCRPRRAAGGGARRARAARGPHPLLRPRGADRARHARRRRRPGDPRGPALPAGPLARGRRGAQLPPLLRRDDAGGRAGRGPAVFDATHALVVRAGRATASSTACASTTPTAWPTRRLPRAAGRGDRRRLGRRREDPRAGRAAARRWACAGTTGYDALNRVSGLFVDPAGERRSPPVGVGHRRRGVVRRGRRRRPSSGAARGAGRRGRPPDRGRAAGCSATRAPRRHRAGCARRWSSCSPPSTSTAPTCRRPARRTTQAREHVDAAVAVARRPLPDRAGEIDLVRSARAGRGSGRPRRAGVRHPLPADLRAGDGQGRRGHHLLPLPPAVRRSTRSAATRAASACRSRSSTTRLPGAAGATGRWR